MTVAVFCSVQGDILTDTDKNDAVEIQRVFELIDAPTRSAQTGEDTGQARRSDRIQPAASQPLILLVDDLQSNLDLLLMLLADQPWQLATARSGAEALRLIPELHPDLVLLDVLMPGMDGFETCRQIKQLEGGDDLPVMFLTAECQDLDKGFEVGAIDYINKPLRRSELQRRIDTHLSLSLLTKGLRTRLMERESLALLGEIVAEVSHEIDTPLGVCVTATSVLNNRLDSLARDLEHDRLQREDLAEFITTAREAGRMLNDNTQSALEMMAGLKLLAVDQSSGRSRRVALKSYVELLVRNVQLKLSAGAVHVCVDIPADLMLYTKPGLLSKILRNLVNNSLVHAFIGRDAGQITIQARASDSGGVELIYRDDGCGIPADHQGRIFERFFTTRPDEGGSGLGLHLVQTATAQLQGTLKLRSAPGRGTEFTIHLPHLLAATPREDSGE